MQLILILLVRWLGYVPKRTGVPLPVYQPFLDDPARDIAFIPTGKYDSRFMLAGCKTALGTFSPRFP